MQHTAMHHTPGRRSKNKSDMEQLLLGIISKAGGGGATITDIEAAAGFDRHTITKYLLVLEEKGVIACREVGKAKLWMLNTAPLESVFSGLAQSSSFVEQVLSAMLTSVPQALVPAAVHERDRTQDEHPCQLRV
jgi:DNA-binding IclR family transcriptional regulator